MSFAVTGVTETAAATELLARLLDQSATTDDAGDRVSGTPEPAVCPETVKTESDTPPLEHGESQNGGHSCGNHLFFKNLLALCDWSKSVALSLRQKIFSDNCRAA
ncbi:MAG: hypothetical protein FD161_2243 [Limisphaerales bacterium]|nr:MAG: hypothetical protein FD161_2243 [Limisphaerales bacterium]KAG0508755.1 MAG: hypothetical protein E1N63_2045 [Limisphaerales bacterium]TXT50554.1 MAG: hypothetical protein FD140_2338 [Limisphaerales bacterium]